MFREYCFGRQNSLSSAANSVSSGRNTEGETFRELLRRKQSSAKISKISRTTLKLSTSDIFDLLRHLLQYLLQTFFHSRSFLGNGRNTVSRVLFRKTELTEFCRKLGEFWEKLGEFAFSHK